LSTAGLAPINATADTFLSDVPNFERTVYYALTSVDSAENESQASVNASVFWDINGPTAIIALDPPPPYRSGQAAVTLTCSEPVVGVPALSLMPASGTSLPVILSGSGRIWNGTLTITDSTGEGLATFAYSATDGSGNTGTSITSGGTVLIDRTAPPAPYDLQAKSLPGGRVTLTWIPDPSDPPSCYNVYRDTADIVSLTGRTPYLSGHVSRTYSEVPPADGRYYYAVQSIDLAGNLGVDFRKASVISDRISPPQVTSITATVAANGKIRLAWQRIVEPGVTYTLYRRTSFIDSVAGLTPMSIGIPDTSVEDIPPATGTYYYATSAVDASGNEGGPSPCVSVFSDVVPPSAAVTISPSSPVKSGTVRLSLSPSEPLAAPPSLSFRPPGGQPKPIALTGENGLWYGQFAVTDSMNNGPAWFYFSGTDSAGNVGQNISNGASFEIDNQEPSPIINLAAASKPNGYVSLSYSYMDKTAKACSVRLYISEQCISSTAGLVPTMAAKINSPISVQPEQDGLYYFAVTAIDSAGNESQVFNSVISLSDRIPPAAPSSFNAEVGETSIVLRWNPQEADLKYALYRDTLPAFPIAEPKRIKDNLFDTTSTDVPPRVGTYYYSLVPVDAVGNTGPSVYSNPAVFTTTLPTADITLSPSSPLKTDAAITVTVAESLISPPKLSCKTGLGQPIITNISLTGSGTVWNGTLNVRQAGQGKAQFLYSATDPAGRTSSTITSGEIFTIDTIPPTAGLTIYPGSPVTAGEVKVKLNSNDALVSADLVFTPMGGVGQPIAIADSGNYWIGRFNVTPQMHDGVAFFSFMGEDSAGNIGTRITGGSTFIIDNTPPPPPTNARAASKSGGRIELSWLPAGSDAIGHYSVYRSTYPITDTVGVQKIANKLTVTGYSDMPATDGRYYYAVTSTNVCGLASAPSTNVIAYSDRLAPGAPISLTASVLPGKVRVGWEHPLGELPNRYRMVRALGTARDTLGLVADSTLHMDRPVLDGHYVYYVTSLDSIGNESQAASIACDFVQTLPVARITMTPPSPVRHGQPVLVLLRTSRRLVSTPLLQFKPANMDPVTIAPLTFINDTTWNGNISVNQQTGDGRATFIFSGQDSAGNVGTGIAAGDTFTIDTQGPEAHITISPKSPVKSGVISVTLKTHEKLRQAPYLDFEPAGRSPIVITLSGTDTLWQGQFTVTQSTGDGLAIFHYEGVDMAGISTNVVTSGKFLSIDTDAPPAPSWMTAAPQLEGGIKIKWQVPRGLLDRSYRIYRANQPFTSLNGLTPLTTIASLGQYNPFDDYYATNDNPAMDGIYYYAVMAFDSAGNEGGFVQGQSVRCDRVAPNPPTGLAVSQIPNGSLKFTWQRPAGEVPFYYNVYCSETPLVTTIGASKIGDHIPWTMVYGCPNHDGHYYFAVTAVDTAGNESPVSQMAEFDFANYPPTARIKLSPTNWLKIGSYQVTLTSNEELDSCFLSYTPLSQSAKNVALSGSGTTWTGTVSINNADSNGAVYFTWRGVSSTGEQGHIILEGEYFVIDHVPPLPVESLEVKTVGNVGGLEVSWKVPRGETPRYYKIYRSDRPVTDTTGLFPVWEKRIDTLWTYIKHVDVPPVDGWYHYAVVAADLAGNWGTLSHSDSGLSTRDAPTASIKMYTAYSGARWTDRIGIGEVRVVLQPSELLSGTPQLKYAIEGGDSIQVPLSDSAGYWIGDIIVNDQTPNGTAGFGFFGRDNSLNPGTEVVYGREFLINTNAPVAEVIIPEVYRMKPDVFRNRLVTRPLRAGTWPVRLTTSTPLFDIPHLSYTPAGSACSTNVQMNGFEQEWTGSLVIQQNAEDTTYQLAWLGQDREGNRGDIIDSVRYEYDYWDEIGPGGTVFRHIGNTYATTGGKFQIDTRPPNAPQNVRLEARQGGVAAIYWDHPEGELPGGYDLYRDVYPITESSIANLNPIKRDIMALIAVDDPPVDGTYYYTLKATDLAGNKGSSGGSPSVFIDSWKPEIKYTAVPSGGMIVLRAQSTEPLINFNCVLSFPGGSPFEDPVLGGENGAMGIPQIIQRSPTEWDIIILPQQISYFNGEIEVHVMSPDIVGNVTRSNAGIAVEPVTPNQGGSIQSTDGVMNVVIPPGFVPVIPGGPQIPNALDREHLFFIVCERMEGVDERIPRESEPAQTIDLSRVHPGLKLVGVPYTICLGSEPGEPEFMMDPSYFGGTLPEIGPQIVWNVPQIRDQYNDTSYMRRKIRPYKWRPQYIDTTTGLAEPGKWEALRECVQFADSTTFIVPVTSITKYALFAELKPPKIMSCTPNEATVLHSYQPVIRIDVEDFGTGIDPSSVELKIDGMVVGHQYLEVDPWKGVITYTPTEPLVGTQHTAKLRVEDVVENACVHQWMFFIDNLPPTIASAIPEDSCFTRQVRPVISCVVTDVGGGVDSSRVSLDVDGSKVSSSYDPRSGRIVYLSPSLPEGWHSAKAVAFDNIGMKTERTWVFAVDTTGPRVTGIVPSCSTFANSMSQVVEFTLTDSLSGLLPDSTRLLIDGEPTPWEFDSISQEFVSDTLGLVEGWHQARLWCSDILGNRSERIWSFGIDRTPPEIARLSSDSATVAGILLRLEVKDTLSGIDSSTITVSLNGKPAREVSFDRQTGTLLAFVDSLSGAESHLAEAVARDMAGNISLLQWEVVLSGGFNNISEMLPSPGSIINNARPEISATILGTNIQTPRMFIDGAAVAAVYDTSNRRIQYLPAEDLPQGQHRITVEADSSCNDSWSFTIDCLPPVITECLPVNTVPDDRPMIAVKCGDQGVGLCQATGQITIDGANVATCYLPDNGLFLHSPQHPLSEGTHWLAFTVMDGAGNIGECQWEMTVDTTLSMLSECQPAPASFVNQGQVSISFMAGTAIQDSSVRATIDWQTIDISADSTGRYSALVSGPVVEGLHLVTVQAREANGRQIMSSWMFTSDTTAPRSLQQQPPPGSFTDQRRPLIAIQLDEQISGIDGSSLAMNLDGILRQPVFDTTSGTLWYQPLVPLACSLHTVTVLGSDRAGNLGSFDWSFFVDNGTPQVTEISPAQGTYVSEPRPQIWARLSSMFAAYPPESLAIYLDGTGREHGYDSLDCRLWCDLPQNLENGRHEVIVFARARNGQEVRRDWCFIVDLESPNISALRPGAGSRIYSRTPLVSARILDQNLSGQPAIRIDGTLIPSSYHPGSGLLWGRPPAALGIGTHTAVFTAFDMAGSGDSAEVCFNIDRNERIIIDHDPINGALLNADGQISIYTNLPLGELNSDSIKLYLDQMSCGYQLIEGDSGTVIRYDPPGALEEGSHIVSCHAVSSTGHSEDVDFLFQLDRTVPAIRSPRPRQGSYQSTQNVALAVILSDSLSGVDIEGANMLIDGMPTEFSYDCVNGLMSASGLSLTLGNHEVYASASDRAGNISDYSWQFMVVGRGGGWSQFNPTQGQVVSTLRPTISARLEPDSWIGIDSVFLWLDDGQVYPYFDRSTGTLSYVPDEDLLQGSHAASVIAVDSAGQELSANWQFYIDNQGPVFGCVLPNVDGIIASPKPVIWAELSDDGSGIDPSLLMVTVDGINMQPEYSSGYLTVRAQQSLADGLHGFYISAGDYSGRRSEYFGNFIIDARSPLISEMLPLPGTMGTERCPTVSARIWDLAWGGDAGAAVMRMDGQLVECQQDPASGHVTYQCPVPLEDGTHFVDLSLTDSLGRTVRQGWCFGIDTRNPQITDFSPEPRCTVNANRPMVSAKIIEEASGIDTSSVRMMIDSIPVQAWYCQSTGRVTFQPPTALSEGRHRVDLAVGDIVGNGGAAGWHFDVAPLLWCQKRATAIATEKTGLVWLNYKWSGNGNDSLHLLSPQTEARLTDAIESHGEYQWTIVKSYDEFQTGLRNNHGLVMILGQFVKIDDQYQDTLEALASEGVRLVFSDWPFGDTEAPLTGLKYKGKLPHQNYKIAINPGFVADTSVTLSTKGKMNRLWPLTGRSDLTVIGKVKGTEIPAIAINHFGQGSVLSYAFDLPKSGDVNDPEFFLKLIDMSVGSGGIKGGKGGNGFEVRIELTSSTDTLSTKVREDVDPVMQITWAGGGAVQGSTISWGSVLYPGLTQVMEYQILLPDTCTTTRWVNTYIDYLAEDGNYRFYRKYPLSISNGKKRTPGMVQEGIPEMFALGQAFPNPAKSKATIRYQLPEAAQVNLTVYNVLGQVVRNLVCENQKPGYYSISWDGRNNDDNKIASGTYLYRMVVKGKEEHETTKKLIWLR
jgi:hypothetical protein